MRAILINSYTQKVTEIELGEDTLVELQRHVSGYIEVATDLPNGDTIFVDEEGLMKGPTNFFTYRGAHQPFAGNGVVVGIDKGGNTAAAKTSLKTVLENVNFLTREEVLQGRY